MKNSLLKLAHFSLFLSLFLLIFSSNNLYAQETKIRVIKNDAVLRLSPDNGSMVIKELPPGALLDAVETIGEWIKVKLPPDKDGIVITGYIHYSFITFEIKQFQPEPEKKIEQPERRSEAYIDWQNKLAEQKSKATAGLITGLVGLAVAIPCAVLAFTDKEETLEVTWNSITYDEKVKTGYLIGGAVGVVAFVAGMVGNFTARGNIKQLEKEGRIEGYVSAGLLPKYRAIGFQVGISF